MRKPSGAVIMPLLVLVVTSIAFVGCGGSDPQRGEPTPTTGAVTSTADDGTTSSATSTEPVDTTVDPVPSTVAVDARDIEGGWLSDAQTILEANTANVEPPDVDCDGLIEIKFTAGKLSQSGEVDCSFADSPVTVHGLIDVLADYRVDGDRLMISGSVNNTQLSIGAIPGSVLTFIGDGEATWSVEHEVLTIEFDSPAAGHITQTWLRV